MRHLAESNCVLNCLCMLVFMLSSIPAVYAQGTDSIPPEVVSLDFTPNPIGSSSSSQPVTFTLEITDNSSGFQSASWRLVSPSAQEAYAISISSANRISGSSLDGVYQTVFSLPAYNEAGTWHVADLQLADIAGNVRVYDDMPVYGSPTMLNGSSGWIFARDFNHDGIEDIAVITVISAHDLLATVYPGAGNGSFGAGVTSEVDDTNSPQAALIGDFNGDGYLDIAFREVSDEIGGSTPIGVMFGNGNGTFQSYRIVGSLPVGAAMTIADLDGDGRSDIFGAGWWGGIFGPMHNGLIFLWGRSDGNFDQSSLEPTESHGGVLCAGDFDSDGRMDIAWAWSSGKFVVMLGQDGRAFGAPIEHSSAGTPSRFAAADFNNDGKLDLAVLYSAGIGILSGNGDGTFQPVTLIRAFDPGLVPGTGKLNAYDIDHDGRPDLAIASQEGIVIMSNNGDGTFRWYALTKDVVDGNGYSGLLDYAIADFNRDGRADFLAGWPNEAGIYLGVSSSAVTLAASNPTSTFGQAVTLTATVTPASLSGPVTFYDGVKVLGSASLASGQAVLTTKMLKAGSHVLRAAFGGALMIAPASFSAGIGHSVTALPASRLVAGSQIQTNLTTVNLGTADFNRDGLQDLVSGASGGPFEAWLGNGTGTFQLESQNGGGGQSLPRFVIEDLNQDGNPDVVLTEGSYKGKGDGTFQYLQQGPAQVGSASSVWIGDFNGDGKQDRAEWWAGPLIIKLGIGDGSVSTVGSFTTSLTSAYPDPFVGDFNGDGNLDLGLTTQTENHLTMLLGNGDGTFQAPLVSTIGTQPKSPVDGDFNGDGKPDIAYIRADTGTISLLLGNGDGSFAAGVNLSLGGTLARMLADDFNGDGYLDLAVLSLTNQRLYIFPGNGNGTFGPSRNYYVGANPYDLVTGDFNGDGRMDLAVALSGKIAILLGANPSASSVSLSIMPASTSLSQQVTMTATVGPSGASGWVTFYDGATVLGSAQVSGGEAVFQTRLLGSGSHLLRAVFSGDGTIYSSSVSGVQTQKVTASSAYAYGASVSLYPGVVDSYGLADFNNDGIPDLAVKGGSSMTALLSQGNGQFVAATPASVYNGSMSMVTADFNRDGNTDVMLSGWDGNANMLFGRGDGTFQSSQSVSGLTYSGALIVADFNGDGAPDLLDPGNSSGSSHVLLNRGNGTFVYPISYAASSSDSNFTVVGDLNGDGLADLIVPDSTNSYVKVLIGKGDGTFQAPVSYPTIANPFQIVIADFNGDSFPDLAVKGGTGQVAILLGDGGGTFENWGDAPSSGLTTVRYFNICDCDGDGKTDLLLIGTVSGPWKTRVLRGLGDGTFASPTDYASFPSATSYATYLLPADFNLDGRPDFVLGQVSGSSYVLYVTMAIYQSSISLNVSPSPAKLGEEVTFTATLTPSDATGTVSFYDGATLLGNAAISSGQAVLKTKWLGSGLHNLRARYSGDPLRYVSSLSPIVTGTVRSGRSSGFGTGTTYETGRGPRGIAVGDLNKDGKQDMVVANATSNTVSVLLGNGTGGFAPKVSYNVGSAPVAVAVTDINGDGNPDVAVANSGSSNVSILLGNGDGTLQTAVNNAIGVSPVSIAAADVNADGLADLVVGTTDGIYALLGTTSTMSLSAIGTGAVSGAAVADVDGDGRADVPVTGSGYVWVRLQGQTWSFSNSSFIGVGTTPASLVVGDFNGDGNVDVATANTGSNDASVVIGNGNGTFQNAVSYAAGTGPVGLSTTDYSGDGKLDLIIVNGSGNSITLLKGKGDGTFTAGSPVPTGGSPAGVAAADFNGDGVIDLAVTNSADNTISVFLGKKAVMSGIDFDGDGKSDAGVWRSSSGMWYGLPSGTPGTYFGIPWGVAGDVPVAGDYDGDGKTDIAVWRPGSGTWYVLPSSAPGTYRSLPWGVSSDKPVPGDYDGDGVTDMAIWRSGSGTWYVLPSGNPGTYYAVQWGASGDRPVAGDYDGDGTVDIAVWRPDSGTWYILPSSVPGTYRSMGWGAASDQPSIGDYDGDGKTDIAVYRPGSGMWYILPSGAPGTYTGALWGQPTDVPAAGDYDGDGKTDIAVYRPGTGIWYLLSSRNPGTYTAMQWGNTGDEPITSLTRILQ
jgi:hypothetical protein